MNKQYFLKGLELETLKFEFGIWCTETNDAEIEELDWKCQSLELKIKTWLVVNVRQLALLYTYLIDWRKNLRYVCGRAWMRTPNWLSDQMDTWGRTLSSIWGTPVILIHMFSVSPQSLQPNAGIVFRIEWKRFLPCALLFTTHNHPVVPFSWYSVVK